MWKFDMGGVDDDGVAVGNELCIAKVHTTELCGRWRGFNSLKCNLIALFKITITPQIRYKLRSLLFATHLGENIYEIEIRESFFNASTVFITLNVFPIISIKTNKVPPARSLNSTCSCKQ
jgi:hypothetical protein